MLAHTGQVTELIADLLCSNPQCMADGVKMTTTGAHMGSSSELSINYPECQMTKTVFSSPTIRQSGTHEKNRTHKVNQRLMLFTQEVGLGHTCLEHFSNATGIPIMHQKSYLVRDKEVAKCVIASGQECLKAAVEHVRIAYSQADPEIAVLLEADASAIMPISVSYDGTWQKRGFTSLMEKVGGPGLQVYLHGC
jgi:hypothetical protein